MGSLELDSRAHRLGHSTTQGITNDKSYASLSLASVLGKYAGDTGSEKEPRAQMYAMDPTWGLVILEYAPHCSFQLTLAPSA